MRDSRNENDDDLLTGAFNVMIDHINKKMQNSLPVKVTRISSDRKFVDVQPQILVVDSEGGTISRSEIKGIPVVTSGSGGFLISFNISVGDLGWIQTSDRDISLFKQYYANSKPNTKRMHSFSDSRFIPDIMTNFEIDAEDSDSMTIQNRDASVKISLNNSRIKIKAPALDIETTGLFKSVCAGGIDLNGFIISPTGAAESPVSLTAPSAIIGGKEIAGHNHSAGSYNISGTPVVGNSGVNN